MNARSSVNPSVNPVDASPPLELDPEFGWQRGFINAFVIFHVCAIIFWNMPISHLQQQIKGRISRYMGYLGLDQGWGMFAPEPGRENYYMQARFTMRDGTKRYLDIGREDNLNPFARLIDERERKLVENLYNPNNGLMHYNQMALWQLRKLKADPGNPPVKVELTRHWSPIPPLPDGVHKNPVTSWSSDVVYSLGLGQGTKR